MLQSCLRKGQELLGVVSLCGATQETAHKLSRRLQIRRAQMSSSADGSKLASKIFFRCHNTTDLSWEKAVEEVVQTHESGGVFRGIAGEDIIACGRVLQTTNALPALSLPGVTEEN